VNFDQGRRRDRALFDLAIDSKLRGGDLVKMKIGSVIRAHLLLDTQATQFHSAISRITL
jgi:hypothetical protein